MICTPVRLWITEDLIVLVLVQYVGPLNDIQGPSEVHVIYRGSMILSYCYSGWNHEIEYIQEVFSDSVLHKTNTNHKPLGLPKPHAENGYSTMNHKNQQSI